MGNVMILREMYDISGGRRSVGAAILLHSFPASRSRMRYARRRRSDALHGV